jgi:HAD superfamily hydrolase (TIGR01662 family)
LAVTKAIIFDFIGTLTNVKDYRPEMSKLKMYEALVKAGFIVSEKNFFDAYDRSYEKYRLRRYQELVEITDSVWISDALNCLRFQTDPSDLRVKTAVNVFFEGYLDALELNPCADRLLAQLPKHVKIGLVSNFTYAPVIYAALRKLRINKFFNSVLVSQDVGWRKPNPNIFHEALKRLGVKADETVYVGDSPLEDIGGAARTGMKTVFVPSQFYSLENMYEAGDKPDLIVANICELCRTLPKFIKTMEERF